MPADIKTGIVRHALETSMMFLRNAALKNGIAPMPAGVAIDGDSAKVSQVASTQMPAPAPSSALKTAGLVGLSMLAGGGLGGLALSSLSAPTAPSSSVMSVESASSSITGKESPLQWLEDQGLNVTPKEAASGS